MLLRHPNLVWIVINSIVVYQCLVVVAVCGLDLICYNVNSFHESLNFSKVCVVLHVSLKPRAHACK